MSFLRPRLVVVCALASLTLVAPARADWMVNGSFDITVDTTPLGGGLIRYDYHVANNLTVSKPASVDLRPTEPTEFQLRFSDPAITDLGSHIQFVDTPGDLPGGV